MGCLFSAKGKKFAVEQFCRRHAFKPIGGWRLVDRREHFQLAMRRSKEKVCIVWKIGVLRWQHKPRGPRYQHSGFCLDVSKGFGNVPRQIRDAIRFLRANAKVLLFLRDFRGVESMCLDFGFERIPKVIQCSAFPHELLRRAGALGIDLEISIYPQATAKSRKRRLIANAAKRG